jgi:protocatechuate 3,4-dioxygenase beta subunit
VLRAGTNEAVTTFHLATTHEFMASTQTSRTVHDPEGRFSIKEEQGETLTMAITAKGYAPKEEEVKGGLGEQPVHDIIVRLQPGGLVDGEVMDTSANAVAGAAVYIGLNPSAMDSSDHRGRAPDAVSGTDGSFRLDTLPGTATTIYASHPSFAVGSGEVRASGPTPARLRIVLSDGGAIEGIVRWSGQPLTEQWIGVLNESGENVRLSGSQTDSQGRFWLEHMPPGLYTLYTYINEFSWSLHLDAEVEEGMITQVDFDFDETDNAIEGIVLLDGQEPSSLGVRAEIRIESGVEKTRFSFQTGAYILTDLPIGEAEVNVTASRPGGFRTSESFVVSVTGGIVRHDLNLYSEE